MAREGGPTTAGTEDAGDWPRGVAAPYPVSCSGSYSPLRRPSAAYSCVAAPHSLIRFFFLYPPIVP
jgi:hypothetical protein